MQFKLALSTAILGTITVSIAGYAKTSSPLANTQALTCPALTGNPLTAIELSEQTLALTNEADPSTVNQLLAITALCNGYGYGGADVTTDLPNAGNLNSTTPAKSGAFLYIDKGPTIQTPQATAEFDQLPQDRIELKAPI